MMKGLFPTLAVRLPSIMLDEVSALLSTRSGRSLSPIAESVGRGIFYSLFGFAMLVLVAPIFFVIGVSLNGTQRQVFPPEEPSLFWFREFLFNSPDFFDAFFFVSLPIAFIVGLLAILIGFPAGYLLARRRFTGETFVQAFTLGPLIVPAVIIGLGMMLLYAELDIEFHTVRLISGHLIITVPYAVLITMATMDNVDPGVEEAARNLGASKLQTLYKITLPLVRSGLIGSFLFAFILSFTDIYMALFVTQGKLATIPLEVYRFLLWQSSPIVAAISTMQILLTFALVVLIARIYGFGAFVEDT